MSLDKHNGLQQTISQALEEMNRESGGNLKISSVNLAELGRRTGLSRKKLRKLKEDGFVVKPHGNTGKKRETSVMAGFTGVADELLKKGISNSSVIFERLEEAGYTGSLTSVKEYIADHKSLIPPARKIVSPQGNRGRRYHTDPGEAYQMDWGFAEAETPAGEVFDVSCFVLICHHCGERFVEFFPNAKQENLFIGMIHSFQKLGVPGHILTDNMKSVTTGRDAEGRPIWNREYEQFMDTVGFETKLCKPRHPFTKGAVLSA